MTIQSFGNAFVDRFNRDRTTTLAASLSYFTALSMAPLLILFVTISSQFSDHLKDSFVNEIRSLIGDDAAKTVQMIIDSAHTHANLNSLAGLSGILTLAVSASFIFGELRASLNQIFDYQPPPDHDDTYLHAIWIFIKSRVLQMGLALSFIFTLIVSLILSSIITVVLPDNHSTAINIMNILISAVFYIGVFTLMFRYLPDCRMRWRKVFRGAFLTAVLFVVGKEAIGFYLGHSAVGSAYGAAGSIIVLLVWVYYSAMITFIGAQVSSILNHDLEFNAPPLPKVAEAHP